MRVIILTQDENLYLPASFATVCEATKEDIVCIVVSPAMSTHGGVLMTCILAEQIISRLTKADKR